MQCVPVFPCVLQCLDLTLVDKTFVMSRCLPVFFVLILSERERERERETGWQKTDYFVGAQNFVQIFRLTFLAQPPEEGGSWIRSEGRGRGCGGCLPYIRLNLFEKLV